MSAEKISYELKRYAGIKRDYTDEEVERLRGSIKIEYSLCKNQSEKLNIQLSDLTSKTDINLQNTISEILDDTLFEDLDILGPEVKDLVSTNPKIGKAL